MPALQTTIQANTKANTKANTETSPVVVSAKWNRMVWTCPMAVTSWNRIVSGFKVARRINTELNDRSYTTYWQFNFDEEHSLKVTYKAIDDTEEGEAYWSKLSDVLVEYDQRTIEGVRKVIKHNRLFKKFEIYYQERDVSLPNTLSWSVFLTRSAKGYLVSFDHEPRGVLKGRQKIKLDSLAEIQCAEDLLRRIAIPWQIAFGEPITPKAMLSMSERIGTKDPDFALQLSQAFKAIQIA